VKVLILPEAVADLTDGYLFYEACEEGVGEYFLDSLSADIRSLRIFKGGHRLIEGYHRMVAKRFPHAIFYRVEDNEIRVHAVIDTRRDPKWISERLN